MARNRGNARRAHYDYFGVDLDIVCDVALVKVPSILALLLKLLGEVDPVA